jgi:ATP-dependent Lhr-like helicase
LLLRWGVLFRDVAAREPVAPPWRDLLGALRRLESRGEIRGGRFVEAYLGEQFALPEALDLLRAIRRTGETAVLPAGGEQGTGLVEGLVSQNGMFPGQRTGASRASHS